MAFRLIVLPMFPSALNKGLLVLLFLGLGTHGFAQTDEQKNQTPYDRLALFADPDLTDEEVLAAFNGRMRDYAGDEEKINETIDAYHQISSAEKRKAFAGLTAPVEEGVSRSASHYIEMDNPVQVRWKKLGEIGKLKLLQKSKGTALVEDVLSVMIGIRPWDEAFQSEMRKLLLKRFNGNKMAFANFMSVAIQELHRIHPCYYLPESERKTYYPNILPSDASFRLMTGYALIQILAEQKDYWAGKTLVDLYLGFGNFFNINADLKFKLFYTLRERWPGEAGALKRTSLIFIRRTLSPLQLIVRASCGELISGFAWKRLPF